MAEQLRYRKLRSTEELLDFYCGVKEMDEVLHTDLDKSLEENHCDSYIVEDLEGNILAFFALEYDTELYLDDGYKEDLINRCSYTYPPLFRDKNEEDTFINCDRFSAVDISYLAVSEEKQKRGIGSIVIDIIRDIAMEMRPDGLFITVYAINLKNYSAVDFYRKCNFQDIQPPGPSVLRMFMTIYSDKDI